MLGFFHIKWWVWEKELKFGFWFLLSCPFNVSYLFRNSLWSIEETRHIAQHWVYNGKPDTHGLCLHGFLVYREAHSIVIIAIYVLRKKKKHYIGLYSKGNWDEIWRMQIMMGKVEQESRNLGRENWSVRYWGSCLSWRIGKRQESRLERTWYLTGKGNWWVPDSAEIQLENSHLFPNCWASRIHNLWESLK